MNQKVEKSYDLVIAMGMMLLAIIAVNVPLFVLSDNKIEAIRQDIKVFHDEMKDFHGRLCAIEERRGK